MLRAAHGAAGLMLVILVAGAMSYGHPLTSMSAPASSSNSPANGPSQFYQYSPTSRARATAISREDLARSVSYLAGSPSGLMPEELELAFTGTGLEGLALYFVDAEAIYQVNAMVLASIAALESSWGASHYAQTRHNLFGYTAYTEDHDAAFTFSSKGDAIFTVARDIRRDYLNEDGKYYRGGALEDIGLLWAADPLWAEKIAAVSATISQRIDSALANN
jgi:beta-N-acetylglucosaminidase